MIFYSFIYQLCFGGNVNHKFITIFDKLLIEKISEILKRPPGVNFFLYYAPGQNEIYAHASNGPA